MNSRKVKNPPTTLHLGIFVFAAIMIFGWSESVARAQAQYRSYNGIQDNQGSYLLAEEARRAAIYAQIRMQENIRYFNTGSQADPPIYRSSLPDVYGYTVNGYVSPRAVRRAVRLGYPAPVLTPGPRAPGDIFGYPYYGYVRQPTGYEKIWTGPNGTVYRPLYNPPLYNPPNAPAMPSMPAEPSEPTPAPAPGQSPSSAQPVLPPAPRSPDQNSPAVNPPEQIPTPPTEPGEKEF
jgi:hypothetical protein